MKISPKWMIPVGFLGILLVMVGFLFFRSSPFHSPGPNPETAQRTRAALVSATPSISATATLTPTFTPTFTASPLPTFTLTPTLTPTPTQTPTPTLPPNVRYPPAVVVLHSKSNMEVNKEAKSLDNVKFLKEFLPLLKDSPFTVTTFEKLSADPSIRNPLILVIDQFYWGIYITPQDDQTFKLIEQAGYPAVVAIVPVPIRRFDNNAMIGEFLKKGWEVANNTDEYVDLKGKDWFHVAQLVGTGGARMSGSILIGRHQFPITVLPPYGNVYDELYQAIKMMWDESTPSFLAHIQWVVANVKDAPYNIEERTHTVGFLEAEENVPSLYGKLKQRFLHPQP